MPLLFEMGVVPTKAVEPILDTDGSRIADYELEAQKACVDEGLEICAAFDNARKEQSGADAGPAAGGGDELPGQSEVIGELSLQEVGPVIAVSPRGYSSNSGIYPRQHRT